jgi:hypothetical protein
MARPPWPLGDVSTTFDFGQNAQEKVRLAPSQELRDQIPVFYI